MSLATHQETSTAIGRESLQSELHALVAGCGAFRLDRKLVSLAGRDRVRWLNGMVSNNIRDLAIGHGVYAFVLNAQGHIQGDLYAFHHGETLFIELESAQAATLLPLLRRYIIMDKVDVEELGDRFAVFGIAGPKSSEFVDPLGLPDPDEVSLTCSQQNRKGIPITLIRGDNPIVPNYRFWVPKEHAHGFWQSLIESGAQETHDEALEAFRILCGIPKFGVDITSRTLPQETGQNRALNFSKGCYIGQEIVERIRAKGAVHRVLTGFAADNTSPSTIIQSEGKDVGKISSVATIPIGAGARVVALGSLRREHLGSVLQAGSTRVTPVPLPFSELLQQL
jgi:folate-binding protein YgfZ